jgi:hypothetical protein
MMSSPLQTPSLIVPTPTSSPLPEYFANDEQVMDISVFELVMLFSDEPPQAYSLLHAAFEPLHFSSMGGNEHLLYLAHVF